MLKLAEIYLREKHNLPENWQIFSFKVLDDKVEELTGAVAPLYIKGPKKGRVNWAKKDRTTEKTFYVILSEFRAWAMQWEEKTGTCVECMGRGEVATGWSKDDGTKHKECPRCKGTGKVIQ